ncbi:MAG: cell envelope integrity protein TolA, partial [Pseudomonadota bacterium]
KAAEAKAKADAEAAQKARQAQEAAAKQKAEAEQRRKADLAAQLAAEENAAANAANARRLNGLKDQYIAAIKAKVERNWLKPSTAQPGMSCEVHVVQMPGGMVMDVKVEKCTGDELFKRSVISAVEKASPLPAPPDPALFDRELVFNFKPE